VAEVVVAEVADPAGAEAGQVAEVGGLVAEVGLEAEVANPGEEEQGEALGAANPAEEEP
jgi:hypothetical protein